MKYFILLLLPFLVGLQLSPAATTLFESGTTQLLITNTQDEAATYNIKASGDLATDLDFPERITIAANTQQPIDVDFTTPTLTPGTYTTLLIIEQLPRTTQETISGAPAVAHRFTYLQPQQGAHIQTLLQTTSLGLQIPTVFTATITNVGTQRLTDAQVRIDILQAGDIIHTEIQALPALTTNQQGRISTTWTAQQEGEYTLRTTTTYAGKESLREERFTVGVRDIELRSTQREDLDAATRISFELYNPYNQPYPHVEAALRVGDQLYQTAPIELLSQETATATFFIEEELEPKQEAQLELRYPPSELLIEVTLETRTAEQSRTWLWIVAALILIIFIYLGLKLILLRGKL